ncbi:hypothetical protein FHS18_006506 [Paenibacillus phyllosphaerae]|uniref:Cardiolipin synthase N-terminal domain-containing protein n=1 Tax=Paenibacillus phyllosphaerae TaxID=274593 RepID=A0A7W5FRC5_9BACL|nr:hypothetical protein [Paenibacillus phyllosphaerae]MBB3114385.1 hypothetical protein [Paenibacillus phyllosphaerae]
MELFLLLWIVSIIALFWVWSDASARRGGNIGCLWALVVFILGPIGLIAYLIVRKMD